MSIVSKLLILAQVGASTWEVIGIIAALALAGLIAWLAGVFRRDSVRGPARLDQDERASTIWMILLLGLLGAMLVPAVYGSVTAVEDQRNATTKPATRPAFTLTETVGVGLASGICVIAALLTSNVLLRPNGIARLGLISRDLKRLLLWGITGVAAVLPLMFAVAVLTQMFYGRLGYEHPNAHQLLRLLGHDSSPAMRLAVIVSAVIVTPLAEEMLFRGHMQTAVLHSLWRNPNSPLARWGAILITSVLFALVHGELWLMPPIFLLSVCLGYAYERTGNLWVPIIIHASFNAANIANFLLQPST